MKTSLLTLGFCLMAISVTGCGADARTDSTRQATSNAKDRGAKEMNGNPLSIPLETILGDTTTLADLGASAILLVNVASECGFTPQYEGLESLYRRYKDSGLVVVGFPANNFGGQEPGTNAEILSFCTTSFDVTFPMMAKVSVKGKDKHPLYKLLSEHSRFPGELSWNFEKFLLDRNGQLVARYRSKVEPLSAELLEALQPLLESEDS